VVGIEEVDTGWRKSYLIRPAVRPEAAMHVLVGVRKDLGGDGDLTPLWHISSPADTLDPDMVPVDSAIGAGGTR
jgi:hypothetical protein